MTDPAERTVPHESGGWKACPRHCIPTGWWHWCRLCQACWGPNPWGWRAWPHPAPTPERPRWGGA